MACGVLSVGFFDSGEGDERSCSHSKQDKENDQGNRPDGFEERIRC